MEQVIETLANGLGNTIGFMAESGILFLIFAALWAAFAIGLIWSQGSIDAAWAWIGSLPVIVKAIAWLLFLPVMAGLWVWETTWPLVLRVVILVGLAGWNLVVLLPRWLKAS
jgi:hypothetical protein